MILVDTSVWIDHLRKSDSVLRQLLDSGQVLCHPFIIGELGMGSLKDRETVLGAMEGLPAATVAHHNEVMHIVSTHSLFGLGIGYIDAHLLASTRITPHAKLWTRDRRLRAIASQLSITYP
jgi:hypothetical protein